MIFIDGLNHLEILTGYDIRLSGVAGRKGGGVFECFQNTLPHAKGSINIFEVRACGLGIRLGLC